MRLLSGRVLGFEIDVKDPTVVEVAVLRFTRPASESRPTLTSQRSPSHCARDWITMARTRKANKKIDFDLRFITKTNIPCDDPELQSASPYGD